jgi:mRNA interferase MazF
MAVRHPYRRGDVVIVSFPFSDATGQKQRPAVVISTDAYHDEWDELLLVALTSRPPRIPRPTDYRVQDLAAAGLSQPSWTRAHLAAAHRGLVLRKIGRLSARDLPAVEQTLRVATGL